MNAAPNLRHRGFNGDPRPAACGRTAMDNRQRYDTASWLGLDFNQVTNLRALAREIRGTWPR